MAGLRAAIVADNIATGTSTKTLAALTAASNHAIKLLSVEITFQGTSTTAEPIEVQLARITTDGGTSTASTEVKLDPGRDETIQTAGTENYTGEPSTYGDILKSWMVHPQSGLLYVVPSPEDILVPGGGIIGVRVVTPAATVDCSCTLVWEE